MQVRLLIGPAGSGKTFRCLAELRQELTRSVDGPPLLLLAPKQTTYQLERQLLADPSLAGYTRLEILSFDRLAYFIFEQLGRPAPALLEEEGRLMVLRGLLAQKRDRLKLFRASARLTGFAQQLSLVLRELQQSRLAPADLLRMAAQVREAEGLAYKLQDLATLLQDYLTWLAAHQLQDADCLLTAASQALAGTAQPAGATPNPEPVNLAGRRARRRSFRARTSEGQLEFGYARGEPASGPPPAWLLAQNLWVDGFAQFSQPELELLATVLPRSGQATITLGLEQPPAKADSWLSTWSVARQTFEDCRQRFSALAGVEVGSEVLRREPGCGRFAQNPPLEYLERCWADPQPAQTPAAHPPQAVGYPAAAELSGSLRLAACADPEAEVTLAAREILRFVRAGGRYRDAAVLVRKLDGYHRAFQRVFPRYEIPFFLDQRESVAHHPLAELTRSALRTVAFGWQHADWFAALKTGLVPAADAEIDQLENEALARGWRGKTWRDPIHLREPVRSGEEQQRLSQLEARLEALRCQLVPPFSQLALALAAAQDKPTGPQLAAALRHLWEQLNIPEHLRAWVAAEPPPAAARGSASVHTTVWSQMNAWLDNVELAFPAEPLPVRQWLPILEAGLANLTVGLIPPALDQVLIGALDRSRNPDIKLGLVLGLNETVFPALPQGSMLLTESDRAELERCQVRLGSSARQQLARERYLAYLACTRARQRLVLTYALHDAQGTPLNPSSFVSQLRQLFPSLPLETVPKTPDWRESEHAHELVTRVLTLHAARDGRAAPVAAGGDAFESPAPVDTPGQTQSSASEAGIANLLSLPGLAAVVEQLQHLRRPEPVEALTPATAAALYGPVLRTSVSRMEQFAACPFKFFVHSGLRAEERQLFELDLREQGTFQHDALALFHSSLRRERLHWRDLTPDQARDRIAVIARSLAATYRDGLLEVSEETRFLGRMLTESLQEFVWTLTGWMRGQYRFDPAAVELPFGEAAVAPWTLDPGNGHLLELYGRIDRVDLHPQAGGQEALCVVVDYKSSEKRLDKLLLANGLQLQLLTYLNVLRRWPTPQETFGFARLIPAGVFYVNLRGKFSSAPNRREALEEPDEARKRAYRHIGRFDWRFLPQLDARPSHPQHGDQFQYQITKSGQPARTTPDAMPSTEFAALLDSMEVQLKDMGVRIYAGEARIDPYRRGGRTACSLCDYRAICRIDPWTHRFRKLRAP